MINGMINVIIVLLAIVGFIAIIAWIGIPFESKGKKGDEIIHYTDD